MSSKKVVRNNATATPVVAASAVSAVTPAPVVAAPAVTTTPAVAPVVATPAETQPKKGRSKKATPTVEATATTAPVVAAPATAPKGRGGRKAATATVAPATDASVAGGAPKAKRARKGTVTATVEATPAPVVAEAAAAEEDDGRRSFKARFPDQELFDGRFIGSTPYQAGSKALSIYYRNFKKANPTASPPNMIRFSICETTRGSNKAESSYIGSRKQLDAPVSYTISGKDGTTREIVKNFKNHLQRVKLGENGAEMVGGMPLSEYMAQGSSAVVATPVATASASATVTATATATSPVAAEAPAKASRKGSKKQVAAVASS